MKNFKYVFGPVPSRRLGHSLGIDIIPAKTCSYNCIYCQIGRTPRTCKERKSFVPVPAVIHEIRTVLKQKKKIDHITFSGSGEPTLNKDLGTMIARVKRMTSLPVAVITNGSLLWQPAIANDVRQADVVLPTLDFGSTATLRKMHRPARGISFKKIVRGLVDFRRSFAGRIWLEVFLVKGINTDRRELARIKIIIDKIKPDRIHLNTAVRPAAEQFVRPLKSAEMIRIKKLLGKKAEIIAEYKKEPAPARQTITPDRILAMLKRRPLTMDDLQAVLGIKESALKKLLTALDKKGIVRQEKQSNKIYYTIQT